MDLMAIEITMRMADNELEDLAAVVVVVIFTIEIIDFEVSKRRVTVKIMAHNDSAVRDHFSTEFF